MARDGLTGNLNSESLAGFKLPVKLRLPRPGTGSLSAAAAAAAAGPGAGGQYPMMPGPRSGARRRGRRGASASSDRDWPLSRDMVAGYLPLAATGNLKLEGSEAFARLG